jgi:hypothetical protein
MKWNWGTKLIVVFGVFVLAMIWLVAMTMRQDVQLVKKEYYQEELRYQQVINARSNAHALGDTVVITKTPAAIRIQLPVQMRGEPIRGKVMLYCAAAELRDKNWVLLTDSNGVQEILSDGLAKGSYTIRLSWEKGDKTYYTEHNIQL